MQFRKIAKPPRRVLTEITRGHKAAEITGEDLHRFRVLVETWSVIADLGGFVPVGTRHPLDLIRAAGEYDDRLQPIQNAVNRRISELENRGVDLDEIGRIVLRNELTSVWTNIKSIELSDTPNWYVLTAEDLVYVMNMSLGGMKYSDIVFPFEGFHIEVPDGFLSLWVNDKEAEVRHLSVGKGHLDFDRYKHLAEDVLGTSCLGKDILFVSENVYEGETSASISHFFPIDKDSSINEMVVTVPRPNYLTAEQKQEYADEARIVNDIVIGLLVLINERKVEKAYKHKRKRGGVPTKKTFGLNDIMRSSMWVVGSKVKLAASSKNSNGSIGTKPIERRATAVSGHFRRYRCGPKNDWHYEVREIKPHTRGGVGPVLGNSYEV